MAQPDNAKLKRLIDKLKELFQLDQPELDFGIYRIMHAKSGEVTQFLEKDLLPQVRDAFAQFQSADGAEAKKKLGQLIAQLSDAGVDPETSPKVQELRAKVASAVDIASLENEVYDHLYTFFRRYYSEGDFLSKRVYKEGVYAIPYEGEEVKLYWANHDQYYIKTSEYLRDYAFRLRPHDSTDPMRVHFRLVDAAEGEHGNVKAAEGKERQFILAPENSIAEEAGELSLRFEYRPARVEDWPEAQRAGKDKPPSRDALVAIAEQRVFAANELSLQRWLTELQRPQTKADGEQAEYSRLVAHLRRYTARHTFDYFIHKDLDGFLRRELDFYIKNEVMRLDDIESELAPKVEQYLSKISAMRRIAGKIIDFLTQLEEFQKKLWLKKKFVVETSYCIRVDCIPEGFYAEIVANEAQCEEWIRICRADRIIERLPNGNLQPLDASFVKAHPSLPLDTQHFDADFTARLLDAVVDLDRQTDGVLFHSENFQALQLMQVRYRGRVDCIYIDPPYNTAASAIDYKNGYKSSSWISLMHDRLKLSRSTSTDAGVLIAAIDDEQQRELSFLLSQTFDGRLLGVVCVRANPSGRPTQSGYSVSHEYLLFAGNGGASRIGRMPPTPEQAARFSQTDADGAFEWRNLRREGSNSDRSARRALFYPIYIKGTAIRVPAMRWDDKHEEWIVEEEPENDEQVAWPDNENGDQKTWRWEWKTVMSSLDQLSVRKDRSGRDYVYLKRRPHEEGVVAVSSWFDAKYSATEHGTALLKDLFGSTVFSYPKSIHAVKDALYVGGCSKPNSIVLDYFAGSGTTAHAVVELNRQHGGRRFFVMIEAGTHFDTVLLPRMKKVIFASEWKDGIPIRLAAADELKRSPRIIKVVRLESYEDALNNLKISRSEQQQSLLDHQHSLGAKRLREQYLLHYLLEIESRGSASLLNTAELSDPTAYKLKVKRRGSDESVAINVDILETFNWLIGLSVEHIQAPRRFAAEFERDGEGRLKIVDRLRQIENGPWWFRAVSGKTPEGRNALIIWRKLTGDAEKDNLVLEHWFAKQGYSTKDTEFDLIYVNGSNTLENLKTDGDTWKVRLIEDDFHRLMFDSAGE